MRSSPWSKRWIGKPSAIVRAMEAYSLTLSICSKADFDRALPAMKTLIMLNDEQHCLEVGWSGHTYEAPKACSDAYALCEVTIEQLAPFVE